MHIQILLYDGYEEVDVLSPLTIFSLAAAGDAGFRLEPIRLGSATVTSTHGLDLHVPSRLDPSHPPTLLVVPGARWLTAASENAWAAAERRRIASVIPAVHGARTVVAAVGSGALLLGSAGLLRGRRAATHGSALEEIRSAGAELVRAAVVDDGDIITSSGITAGLDLGFWIVERYWSTSRAQALEKELQYERRGTVWRHPG